MLRRKQDGYTVKELIAVLVAAAILTIAAILGATAGLVKYGLYLTDLFS